MSEIISNDMEKGTKWEMPPYLDLEIFRTENFPPKKKTYFFFRCFKCKAKKYNENIEFHLNSRIKQTNSQMMGRFPMTFLNRVKKNLPLVKWGSIVERLICGCVCCASCVLGDVSRIHFSWRGRTVGYTSLSMSTSTDGLAVFSFRIFSEI